MSLNGHWVAMSETQPWKFFALQRLNFHSLKLNFQFLEGNFKISEPCAVTLLNVRKCGRIYHLTASCTIRGPCVGGETHTLFEVLTPLGFTVRTTVKYWSLIETK